MSDITLVTSRPVTTPMKRDTSRNGKASISSSPDRCKEKFLPSQKKMFRHGAIFAAVVIATLMLLSLTHLAEGIARTTGVGFYRAFAMAVGIDMGLIAAEAIRVITATTALFERVKTHSSVIVWVTVILSMFLNALAFCERVDADSHHIALGIVFGIVLPLLVYLLTRIGAVLWVAGRREAGV